MADSPIDSIQQLVYPVFFLKKLSTSDISLWVTSNKKKCCHLLTLWVSCVLFRHSQRRRTNNTRRTNIMLRIECDTVEEMQGLIAIFSQLGKVTCSGNGCKEVVKEVIKEVPVVKEVEVIKEVIKEVPVVKEVVKEVIKEVPVVKEVEVIKEVIKEVPVVKEVEVVKEVPVVKEVIKEVTVAQEDEATHTEVNVKPAGGKEVSPAGDPLHVMRAELSRLSDAFSSRAVADALQRICGDPRGWKSKPQSNWPEIVSTVEAELNHAG